MSGKRLLDAAAVLKAARSVASWRIVLQKNRLDTYNKTSSLSHAIKSQTDRITLTAQAAIRLSQRLKATTYPIPSEDAIRTPTHTSNRASTEQEEVQARSREESNTKTGATNTFDGISRTQQEGIFPSTLLDQARTSRGALNDIVDHNKSSIIPLADVAKLWQRQSEKQIPSQTAEQPPISFNKSESENKELDVDQDQDVFCTLSHASGQVPSSLSRAKYLKNTIDTQESDVHVTGESMNPDVVDSIISKDTVQSASIGENKPEAEHLSEDDCAKLFHSPKIASMLRGGSNKFPSKGSNQAGIIGKINGQSKADQGDQVLSSPQGSPLNAPTEADAEVHNLAADLVKDPYRSASEMAQVIRINRIDDLVPIAHRLLIASRKRKCS